MIDLPGICPPPVGLRPRFRRWHRFRRRDFLHAGLYGAFAAAVNQSRLLPAAVSSGPSPIRSCILLMHYGGPSHLDTWDMKPNAPTEIRGEYRPIATSVPGRHVCEHLPLMSKLVDKLAVIRSMHHSMTNHNAAMYEALIGRVPAGGDLELLGVDRATDFPSMGAAMTFLESHGKPPRAQTTDLPLTHVALPHVMRNVVELAGQNAGFLGRRHDPLQVIGDPNEPDFLIRQLTLPDDISVRRLTKRRDLLQQLNGINQVDDSAFQTYQQRAFELLQSESVRRAFAISSEPEQIRDRYGRHKLGQSLLLARRMVEAGVRFINVNDGEVNGQVVNWDSHEKIFPRHKELLQPADQGFSALIEDLDQRGLLDSTLVVAMGEFGRTPSINANAGRDHWPRCYHVLLAGGGTSPGSTFGSSDRIGAYPETDPVTPGDLAATIFWRFGVDPAQEIHDGFGRPFRLADGKPILPLFDQI